MPQTTRPSLPARSASLPPIHLSSDQHDPSLEGRVSLDAVADKIDVAFPWARLPKEMQQDILRHALFPSELGGSALVMGKASHRTHMHSTAIPILLGQGNWQAYTAAAYILYSEVHLVLFQYPDAAMHFLTSPSTLRLRRLVGKLQIRLDIEHDLWLFDEGWRSTNSVPEARVNVSTALHSMHVHGSLREVRFLLNVPHISYHHDADSMDTNDRMLSTYYLPMARLQLANPEAEDPASFASAPVSQPGREVIAPAFLAGRAFQYGFLPLLREGMLGKSILSLEVGPKDGQSLIEEAEAGRVFRCWLGATILEVLSETKTMGIMSRKWVDPFTIARPVNKGVEVRVLQQCVEGGDEETAPMLVNDGSDCQMLDTNAPEQSVTRACAHPDERIGYKSCGDDLVVSSSIRYDSPTQASDRSSVISVISTKDVKMDFDEYTQGAAAGCEARGNDQVDQACEKNQASQSNVVDDETGSISSYLGTTISHAVVGEVMASVESPQTGENGPVPLLPGSKDGAGSESFNGQGVPLEMLSCLDRNTPAVNQGVRAEHSEPPLSASLNDTASHSTSNLDDTSSEDDCPPSRSTAFKRRKLAFRETAVTTAEIALQDSDGDSGESKSSASRQDDHASKTPTVEVSPCLARTKSGNIASMQSHDGSSSSGSDSDSNSSVSSAGKDHCNKSNLIAAIVNSSMARDSSSSDTSDDSDSSFEDEGRMPYNKSTHIADIFGSSKTRRGEPTISEFRWAANKGVASAIPPECVATLPVDNQTKLGPMNPTASPSLVAPTTTFHRLDPQVPSMPTPAQASNKAVSREPEGPATTGQKRKAPNDGREPVKMSKKARRRANRRARLVARTAGEE